MLFQNHLKSIVFVILLPAGLVAGETNWNQFRGPEGDGISSAGDLPDQFDEAVNVRWKTAIANQGWSSPVVWDDEIWVTTGSDEKQELRALCVDLKSGKIMKDIKVFDMIERRLDQAYVHDSPHLNSPATPTPVVEENRVYVSYGSQGIACLNRKSGEKIWERRDLRVYQPVRQGSSPIVDDKNLYVAYDGTDEQFFVALDKKSGETRWKVNRDIDSDFESLLQKKGMQSKGGKPGDSQKAFATAKLIDAGGKRQLIAPAGEATISYDPETGKELWRVRHPGGFNVAARPLYAHDLVYVFTSGLTGYLMAIQVDGTGDVTDTHVAWSTTRSTPHIPSPIILGDLMFMVTDKGGIVRCLNAKTGEEHWKKRLGGDHWASPFYADGKLYFLSKDGNVRVLPATRTAPETVIENELNARFFASPAVAGSSLILRSATHLYCLHKGQQRTAQQVAADVYPEASATGTKAAWSNSKQPTMDERLVKLRQQLGGLVKAGTLTIKEATEIYKAAQNKK
jgi:outer membrane protein assembly factor BamB|tara:strand:+ start:327 stop:1859 length:1533 start_codon:yes stop_codon:yes gene_type:complete